MYPVQVINYHYLPNSHNSIVNRFLRIKIFLIDTHAVSRTFIGMANFSWNDSNLYVTLDTKDFNATLVFFTLRAGSMDCVSFDVFLRRFNYRCSVEDLFEHCNCNSLNSNNKRSSIDIIKRRRLVYIVHQRLGLCLQEQDVATFECLVGVSGWSCQSLASGLVGLEACCHWDSKLGFYFLICSCFYRVDTITLSCTLGRAIAVWDGLSLLLKWLILLLPSECSHVALCIQRGLFHVPLSKCGYFSHHYDSMEQKLCLDIWYMCNNEWSNWIWPYSRMNIEVHDTTKATNWIAYKRNTNSIGAKIIISLISLTDLQQTRKHQFMWFLNIPPRCHLQV